MCAIDITAEQRKTVLALLARHLPNTMAWVYGSRVKWAARPESDLDLVVFAKPEQERRVSDLREAFEESNLAFRVDLFVWDEVPEQFRKHIEAEHVVLVERREAGVGGEWRDTVYGSINADFSENRLADLCYPGFGIQTGPFGSQLHKKDYVPVGTPIITVEHLGENRILHEGAPCVSEKDRLRLSKYWLRKGDIVFSRVGSVDRRALVRDAEDGWLFSGRCLRVRPNSNHIDAAFLSYFFGLPSFKEHIRSVAVGATMPSLNTQILSDIRVPHPKNLGEQRSIAHILGTLDDKIELNRRMNQTLEEMARALFKSWFVDFDPVRANATLKHHATTPPQGGSDWSGKRARTYLDRMDPDIAALFPDRFVDSELGPIPAGWEVKPLDEIAVFQNGLALQRYRPQENEEWLPVVKIAQLRSGKADSGEKATAKIRPECVIEDGDVVFSWSGSLMVKVWCGGRAALNQHLFKVASTKFPKWFFLLCVHSHLGDFRTIAAGKATTMGHIKRHHLSEAMCAVPNGQLLSAANGLMTALLEKSISASIQSRTLATLRDALLPKMVSGELCVGVGHHFIGDIVTGLNSPPK